MKKKISFENDFFSFRDPFWAMYLILIFLLHEKNIFSGELLKKKMFQNNFLLHMFQMFLSIDYNKCLKWREGVGAGLLNFKWERIIELHEFSK